MKNPMHCMCSNLAEGPSDPCQSGCMCNNADQRSDTSSNSYRTTVYDKQEKLSIMRIKSVREAPEISKVFPIRNRK